MKANGKMDSDTAQELLNTKMAPITKANGKTV